MVMREELEQWAQRTADLAIVATGEKTGVKIHLIRSSLVYGLRDGLFHLQSVQVPLLIRRALAVGHPEVIGDGAGVWDHLHIDDLTSLFDVIVGKIVAGADIPEEAGGSILQAPATTPGWILPISSARPAPSSGC